MPAPRMPSGHRLRGAARSSTALPPGRSGVGAWRISLALLLCLAIVVAGLHTVLQGILWWFGLALLMVALLGLAALTRALSRRRWLPTAVAAAGLAVILTVVFAAGTAILFLVPTFDTLGRFGSLVEAGARSIQAQSVPAEVTFGILFVLCLGIGAITVVADLLAVTLRWPAIAGLPLLIVLAIPASIGIELTDVFLFALAAAAFLLLLRAGQPLRQTQRSLALGAVAVAVALLLPFALPPVQVSLASSAGPGGYLAGVNPVLNLGDDLRRQIPRTVLFYSTQSDEPEYLRLVSLQNFTAETWAPDDPEIDTGNIPQRVGRPPGLSDAVAVSSETTWVDVRNLGSPWLPVPYPATEVSGLSGGWYWDADDLTFTSPSEVARGQEYRVSSLAVAPTPAQLTGAGTRVPDGYERYLELPDDMPAVIADTARSVTQGVTSDYGRAVALQEFFRDGSFEYSETAPVDEGYDGTGMEMIAQFLKARSGYCVHFASAMAVMARTLGIPSRVAVGFLPGNDSGDQVRGRTAYRVTTQELHSWPELYFEGIGWTRFEPTPGRGFVPVYADEENPEVPTPPTLPSEEPEVAPTPSPTTSAAPVPQDDENLLAPSATGGPNLAWVATGLVTLGVLLLLLLPAIVRAVQRGLRMRRLASGRSVARSGWRELLQRAEDLGIGLDPALTPREAARTVARATQLEGADAQALARILARVERERFARAPAGPPAPGASGAAAYGAAAYGAAASGAGPSRPSASRSAAPRSAAPRSAGGLTADLERVLAAVGRSSRPMVRLGAALAPRTIWSRLAGVLRPVGGVRAAISRAG